MDASVSTLREEEWASMVGCGKLCGLRWDGRPLESLLDMDFYWVPTSWRSPAGVNYSQGGFSNLHGDLRGCGDWYDESWQLVCESCMRKAGILW